MTVHVCAYIYVYVYVCAYIYKTSTAHKRKINVYVAHNRCKINVYVVHKLYSGQTARCQVHIALAVRITAASRVCMRSVYRLKNLLWKSRAWLVKLVCLNSRAEPRINSNYVCSSQPNSQFVFAESHQYVFQMLTFSLSLLLVGPSLFFVRGGRLVMICDNDKHFSIESQKFQHIQCWVWQCGKVQRLCWMIHHNVHSIQINLPSILSHLAAYILWGACGVWPIWVVAAYLYTTILMCLSL